MFSHLCPNRNRELKLPCTAMHRLFHAILPVFLVGALSGCGQEQPCPYYRLGCAESGAGSSTTPSGSTSNRTPARFGVVEESPAGITLTASTGSLVRFLGTDSFKLALAVNKKLYMLLPSSDTGSLPRWIRIDRGDEGSSGAAGWPNEPQFSPDGRWLAYAGEFSPQSLTASFVREALPGLGWRVPVVRPGDRAANPRWHEEDGELRLFVTDVNGSTQWDAAKGAMTGSTFMAAFRDTAIDAMVPAKVGGVSLPGAFKGGISLDGKWVGTSYQTSGLFETSTKRTALLNGKIQQCNPSMNPFASGTNTDYMMVLGFGGSVPVPTLNGPVYEGQHENLWVWSKDDKAVWGAKLPNVAPHSTTEIPGVVYTEWQRPRWSTHPEFATAFAKQQGSADGMGYDLIVLKMGATAGELQNHDRATMMERGPVLRLATGSITSVDWSHLWVKK